VVSAPQLPLSNDDECVQHTCDRLVCDGLLCDSCAREPQEKAWDGLMDAALKETALNTVSNLLC